MFKGNKLCDDNVTTVECFSDPCATAHCPNFDDALCIPNHCGECSAHYYNSTGHDVTMMCSKGLHMHDSIIIIVEWIIIMFVVGDCPSERPAVRCIVNPCDHKTCPNLPPTECVLDVCGECKARYYWNNVDVTEFCSKYNTIT